MMAENEIVQQALQHFQRSVEITRDVRFQANLRLVSRQRNSAVMISLLSIYVIALSLLPNIIQLHGFQEQILLACSIVLSVFVIITSLVDGSQNFYHQGELLHQCARKVATVYHELKLIDVKADPAEAQKQLETLQDRYRVALDECPTNHDAVDFLNQQARKPNLFPDNYTWKWPSVQRVWNKFKVFVLSHSWMTLHVIALMTISLIVYLYVLRGSMPVESNAVKPISEVVHSTSGE